MSGLPSRAAAALLAAAAALAAGPARAHHGTAAVAAIGAEGPGAALDTTSPLPLGQGTVLVLARSEYAAFRRRAGFSDQKRSASFTTLAAGYGLTPWLSALVFQPYAVKAQDGAGRSAGFGDTNLMLAAALKWDEGLRLAPERESLDDLEDWHFGLWLACSLPVGATSRRDAAGAPFAPDMQTGFGGPSPAGGLSVLKQLGPGLTLLSELNHQRFFTQRYAPTGQRHRFGAETRVNGALAWRAWAAGAGRVDLVPELSVLHLERDRTEAGTGELAAARASGGAVLYGQLGARWTRGALTLGASLKRAVATRLNEAADQQGAEGLEAFRAALVLGWTGAP